MEDTEKLYFVNYIREEGGHFMIGVDIIDKDKDHYVVLLPDKQKIKVCSLDYKPVNDVCWNNQGLHKFYPNIESARHDLVYKYQSKIIERLLQRDDSVLYRKFAEYLKHNSLSCALIKIARDLRMEKIFTQKYCR